MIVSARKGRKRVSGARYPIRRALLMTELCLLGGDNSARATYSGLTHTRVHIEGPFGGRAIVLGGETGRSNPGLPKAARECVGL